MNEYQSALAALDARIQREILRLRARYELSNDELRGLYITDDQVTRLAAAPGYSLEPVDATVLDRPAASLDLYDPRWHHLARTFALSSLELDVLLIALAPEIAVKYEVLFAYLNDDVSRRWPSTDLIHRLLSDVTDLDTVVGVLARSGRLLRTHLVRRVEPANALPTTLNVGVSVHPSFAHWARSHSPWDPLIGPAVRKTSVQDLIVDDRARVEAQPLLRVWERGKDLPVFMLAGPLGSGRSRIAAAVAAAVGRPLVRIDVQSAAETDLDGLLEGVGIALSLEPAAILLDDTEFLADDDATFCRLWTRVKRAFARWPETALLLVRAASAHRFRRISIARRELEIRCYELTLSQRMKAWQEAVSAAAIDLTEGEVTGLACRFSLTPGQTRIAVASANDLAALDGDAQPSAHHVAAAARLASDTSLAQFGVKVTRTHDWQDLVLPLMTITRLKDLAAAIRQRHVVFEEWGFGDRLLTGTGVKALFAGSSGTGKTMAAGVIAGELGLDLYKIDLSGVMSKYIGETEKNLERVFQAARSSNAILLLDEAEALLGKRSEVKDAHDRYANIEVAYLLQRLEEHDGVVILATNLKRNIDDAFSRRLQYVIDFPRPEERERERIWRGMFPARSPVGDDVDFGFLARQFDLAGGDIRNVVLEAAFLAAQHDAPIDMRFIVESLSRQFAKQGKTPIASEFRQYQGLLPTNGARVNVG